MPLPAEVVDLRQFDSRRLRPLLEEERRVWGETLRWDYSASARLIANCLDERRLAGYALLEEGQVLGYSYFVYEDSKGLIGNAFVYRTRTRAEHATLLLCHVIETLQETPGLERIEAQLPHFAPGELNACFEARHFEIFARRFMVLDLDCWAATWLRSEPEKRGHAGGSALSRLQAGIELRPWDRKLNRAVASLIYNTYGTHIDSRINDQYQSSSGTLRLLENIVEYQGCGSFLPEASFLAVHRGAGVVCGAVVATSVHSEVGHIPQICVSPQSQSQGIGSALLHATFQAMTALGKRQLTLTVTDANAGGVRLYERLGFRTQCSFGAYVWDSEGERMQTG